MKTISKFLFALMAIAIAMISEPVETQAQAVRSGYTVQATSNAQFLRKVALDGKQVFIPNAKTYIGTGNAQSGASTSIEFLDSLNCILLPRISDTTAIDSSVAGLLFYDATDGVLRFHNGTYWKQISIE
ncbi:MAG: hypothetical protein K9G46_07150 [Flavobacteriales bacterium]|nr:hypothetical protein [Flavobacteriales bacterium]